jgi:hypothetical protein
LSDLSPRLTMGAVGVPVKAGLLMGASTGAAVVPMATSRALRIEAKDGC